MELKRFVGTDSKATMDQVRAEYGDDALIISTNKVGNKTEMICAVEEPKADAAMLSSNANEDNAGLDISEATSTVASLLNRVAADNASANNPPRNKSEERIAQEFGKELNSALGNDRTPFRDQESFVAPPRKTAPVPDPREPSPLPPESHEMQAMMQTIQQDLARLRSQLESQAAAEAPLRKAQLAMASINQRAREQVSTEVSKTAEQLETLLREPLSQQRDWSGVHAFIGHPGMGKTTTIATIMQQTLERDPSCNLAIISLQLHAEESPQQRNAPVLLENNGLVPLCQSLGVAFFQANDLAQLNQLLSRYRSNHRILIDTPAALMDNHEALITMVTENELLPHLCLAADIAPSGIASLQAALPWITSSTLITRYDLSYDLEPMLRALDKAGAQISGVNGHLVDEPALGSKKGNSTNMLDE